MDRADMNDLLAFVAVAKEKGFNRAAAKLGVSQSALSHTIGGLEVRLGLRLLTRATRSVALTEVGERLLPMAAPRLEEIAAELSALTGVRDKPAGTIRITTGEHAAHAVLRPALAKLLPDHPEIHVEVAIDPGLTDIVAERYDAGIRLSEQVANDMVAVPVGPEMRLAVVGAPSVLAARKEPRSPQDLTDHKCINLRPPTYGGLYAWETEKDRRKLKVRVEGQMVVNSSVFAVDMAVAGAGLACVLEDHVLEDIAEGRRRSSHCEPGVRRCRDKGSAARDPSRRPIGTP